jgi:hypothetical protein
MVLLCKPIRQTFEAMTNSMLSQVPLQIVTRIQSGGDSGTRTGQVAGQRAEQARLEPALIADEAHGNGLRQRVEDDDEGYEQCGGDDVSALWIDYLRRHAAKREEAAVDPQHPADVLAEAPGA